MKELGRVKGRYEFSLDSRQFGVVLLGAFALAALLFVLGMSVGRQWEKKLAAAATEQPSVQPAEAEPKPEPASVVPEAPPVPPAPPNADAVQKAVAVPEAQKEKEAPQAKDEAKPEPKKEVKPEELTFPKTLVSQKKTEPLEPAKKEASAKAARYTVQLGAYKEKAAAEHTAKAMRGKGYDADVRGASGGLYRVCVGSYQSRSEAEAMSRRLEQNERLKPYVTLD